MVPWKTIAMGITIAINVVLIISCIIMHVTLINKYHERLDTIENKLNGNNEGK